MNSYRKYTTCVQPKDFTPSPLSSAAVAATWLILIAAIVSPLELLAVPWYLPVLIGLDIALIAACYWYLNGRLICLGTRFSCTDQNGNPVPLPDNQECAIGVIGAPGHLGLFRPRISGLNYTKFGDDDSTMEILLAPGPLNYGADKHDYWNQVQGNQVQGYLVEENNDILNVGISYTQSGNEVKYLHCEFEGSGIADLLAFLTTILAFLVALLAILVLAPELAGLIAILEIFASLLGLMSLLNTFVLPSASDEGDPTDIDQSLGNLQAGDIVVVSGDWIYDGGHIPAWNEIHAVHNCQKICTPIVENPNGTWSWPSDIGGGMGLDMPDKVKAARAQWCCALSDACGAVKGGSETDPGNNWVIHPLVDGCNPQPVIV
jgi:hypothetical protein